MNSRFSSLRMLVVLFALFMMMGTPVAVAAQSTSSSNDAVQARESNTPDSLELDQASASDTSSAEATAATTSLANRGKWVYNHKLKNAANPTRAFKRLSRHDRKAVHAYLRSQSSGIGGGTCGISCPNSGIGGGTTCGISGCLSGTTVTSTRTPMSGIASGTASVNCWTWTLGVDSRGFLNNIVWSYSQQINYCENGSSITSAEQFRPRAEVQYLFWDYNRGDEVNQTFGGVGSNYFTAYTQGHFDYCIALKGIGCLQHKYPWIRMTVWANGAYDYEFGG